MHFKKLSMHGFKSFAEPVNIEFDKGITCIVGPNGSGKSNISDALRWVLGEQSPKMLRGGKMDEVIFAGTDTRKSRGMAEVNLVIDNSDKMLPIDFSEVSITRRMYRSGESEYFINNSQCRLRDIRELIMDTGIGVDGYSIIGQGKISEIINGKADTRREIFEEAAGIVKYRSKKAETERKLENTNGNLVRVNDIISELESRVEPLKEEARKAKEYKEISEKYRNNEINVILKNIETTHKQNVIYKNDIDDTTILADENEKKLEEIESKIRQNKKRMDELDEEDQLERERMMNASYELNELKNSIKIDTEKISSLKQSCSLFMDEVKSLTERIVREEASQKSMETKKDELQNRFEAIQRSEKELSDKIRDEHNTEKTKTSEFDSYRDALYELSMKVSSKKAEHDGLKNMLDTLKNRRDMLNEELETGESAENLKSKLIEAEREFEEAKRGNEDAANAVISCKKQQYQLKSKEDALIKKYEIARAGLNEEKTKKNMLEQLESSYEGYNYAVRYIMKESNVRGLYGTVGDLISVPRGYETAIETALGARMQNIICDSDQSANMAVRSLKVKKAGRLTFLPVNSMKVSPRRFHEALAGEPGFIGIAADCIEYDNRYRSVIEYLLGNIVIVKTLEDAIAVSKQYMGFRFVTLEGESINPSGAITGGAYKSNNNAGILERKNRLNSVDKIIYDFDKDLKEIEKELARVRDDIALNEENLLKCEEFAHKSDIRKFGAETKFNSIKEKNLEYAEIIAKRNNEKNRLDEEIRRTEQLLFDTFKEKENAEIKIEDIRKITEILVDDIDAVRKTLVSLNGRMTEIKIELEAVRGQKNNLENLISGTNTHIQDLKKELETKNNNIKNALAEQETLNFHISGTQQAIEMSELKKSNQGNRLSDIKQEKADLSKAYDLLLSQKESVDKTLYTHKSRMYDIELKLRSGETRIEDWKNKIWEDFEIAYLEALEIREPAFNLNEGIKLSRSMKNDLRELGNVNLNAIEEYDEVKKRYDFLLAQRKDLDEAILSLRSIIQDTDNLIRANFRASFNAISRNFADIFTELFNGGKAEIRMDSSDDILESDIEIVVQPPGKKLQNMNLLSGGEKTMTAMALVFAVLKAKPTPFCILDEVEAALDEANIDRFADYLKNLSNIQFVLVTHQKVTMQHANVLFGVTMPEKGVSKVISLKLADADKFEENEYKQ